MGNVALYNYVNKLHIEILYLWVNIVILLDSKNEIKIFGVTAPLTPYGIFVLILVKIIFHYVF